MWFVALNQLKGCDPTFLLACVNQAGTALSVNLPCDSFFKVMHVPNCLSIL